MQGSERKVKELREKKNIVSHITASFVLLLLPDAKKLCHCIKVLHSCVVNIQFPVLKCTLSLQKRLFM